MIVGFPGIAAEYVYSAYLMCGLVLAALTVVLLKGLWHLNTLVDSNLLAGGSNASVSRKDRMLVWVLVSFVEPLAEFFRRNEARLALSILLFIFLFKIGEAFLGRMSIVFYKELGFSNSDIALYSKLVSWWVTIGFSLIGSAVTIHYGVLRGLFIGGFAMAASNLMFAVMAFVGPSKGLLVSAVVVDGFTTAWSTVAFVAFLSMMCNRAFTASQYALMASVGTLGRTFLASYSGWVVDALDGNWALFFTITSLMVVPSMLLLYRVRHRLRQLSADF
jgi:PAT family beta-lactamase induction signal transducer AmpG